MNEGSLCDRHHFQNFNSLERLGSTLLQKLIDFVELVTGKVRIVCVCIHCSLYHSTDNQRKFATV